MEWYVLFVETGKEDLLQMLIRKYFDESVVRAIVPKRKLQERKQGRINEVYRKLFPGYVLLRTRMNVDIYYELKRIPSSFRLLNYNRHDEDKSHLFSKIDNMEILSLLQLIGNDEIIDYSTLYVENAKVKVIDGPLKGKEGLIKRVDKRKKRARIALEFLGNEKTIDVGINVITTMKIRV